jgi:hypothetical protein
MSTLEDLRKSLRKGVGLKTAPAKIGDGEARGTLTFGTARLKEIIILCEGDTVRLNRYDRVKMMDNNGGEGAFYHINASSGKSLFKGLVFGASIDDFVGQGYLAMVEHKGVSGDMVYKVKRGVSIPTYSIHGAAFPVEGAEWQR